MAEIKEASYMFKNMTQEYYQLKVAERRVHKALREKGLYLDQKDFNIMEVFNNAYSEYSFDEEGENQDPADEKKVNFVSVESLDRPTPIGRPNPLENSGNILNKPLGISNPFGKSSVEREFLEVPSFSNSATPNSFTLEKMSLYSRYTNKSHQSFASKNSQRLLFQDANVEKRPKKAQKEKKGDFMCTCNKSHGLDNFYPAIEVYPYRPYPILAFENESEAESILGENEFVRSMSAPAHETHDPEDKMIETIPLVRQPFSNMMNFDRQTHNYPNPLDKLDLKKALRIERNRNHDENRYRYPERHYGADTFGIHDVNMHI